MAGFDDKSLDQHQIIKQIKYQQQQQISKIKEKAETDYELLENLREYLKRRQEIEHTYGQCFEFGNKYLLELHTTYDELDKSRALYEKSAKEAFSSKKTYDKTLEKPNSGLNALRNMVSSTDPEERIEKLKSKWKAAERKLTDARNSYIIAVDAGNCQQNLYYSNDLNNLMKKQDGFLFDIASTSLIKYNELQEQNLESLNTAISELFKTVDGLTQQSESEIFVQENSRIFLNPPKFEFFQCESDFEDKIIVDEVTKVLLGQRLYSLQSRLEEVNAVFQKKEQELLGVRNSIEGFLKNPVFSGTGSNPLDQNTELENDLDIARLQSIKLDTQVKMLLNAGVEPLKPSYVSPYVASAVSKKTAIVLFDYDATASVELTIRDGETLEILEKEIDGWIKVKGRNGEGMVPGNYIDIQGTPVPSPAPSLSRSSLYRSSTSASARNSTSSPTSGPKTNNLTVLQAVYDYNGSDEGELSFKAGDAIEISEAGEVSNDAWWEGKNRKTGKSGSFPLAFTQGWEVLMNNNNYSSTSRFSSFSEVGRNSTVSARSSSDLGRGSTVGRGSFDTDLGRGSSVGRINDVGRGSTFGRSTYHSGVKLDQVKALYDYDPTCSDELRLTVGDIITITSKNTGSDSWWEGESSKGKGQFPANYVIEYNPGNINDSNEFKQNISNVNNLHSSTSNLATSNNLANIKDIHSNKLGSINDFKNLNKNIKNLNTKENQQSLQSLNSSAQSLNTDRNQEYINKVYAGGSPKNSVANLASVLSGSIKSNSFGKNNAGLTQKVKALYDYSAAGSDELSFFEGDVITVLKNDDKDWWDGELKGLTFMMASSGEKKSSYAQISKSSSITSIKNNQQLQNPLTNSIASVTKKTKSVEVPTTIQNANKGQWAIVAKNQSQPVTSNTPLEQQQQQQRPTQTNGAPQSTQYSTSGVKMPNRGGPHVSKKQSNFNFRTPDDSLSVKQNKPSIQQSNNVKGTAAVVNGNTTIQPKVVSSNLKVSPSAPVFGSIVSDASVSAAFIQSPKPLSARAQQLQPQFNNIERVKSAPPTNQSSTATNTPPKFNSASFNNNNNNSAVPSVVINNEKQSNVTVPSVLEGQPQRKASIASMASVTSNDGKSAHHNPQHIPVQHQQFAVPAPHVYQQGQHPGPHQYRPRPPMPNPSSSQQYNKYPIKTQPHQQQNYPQGGFQFPQYAGYQYPQTFDPATQYGFPQQQYGYPATPGYVMPLPRPAAPPPSTPAFQRSSNTTAASPITPGASKAIKILHPDTKQEVKINKVMAVVSQTPKTSKSVEGVSPSTGTTEKESLTSEIATPAPKNVIVLKNPATGEIISNKIQNVNSNEKKLAEEAAAAKKLKEEEEEEEKKLKEQEETAAAAAAAALIEKLALEKKEAEEKKIAEEEAKNKLELEEKLAEEERLLKEKEAEKLAQISLQENISSPIVTPKRVASPELEDGEIVAKKCVTIKNSENINYPDDVSNPNITEGKPYKYEKAFVLAVRDYVKKGSHKPEGMIDIHTLISGEPQQMHRTNSNRAGSSRGHHQNQGASLRGHPHQNPSYPQMQRMGSTGIGPRGNIGKTPSQMSMGRGRHGRQGSNRGSQINTMVPINRPPPIPIEIVKPLVRSSSAWVPKSVLAAMNKDIPKTPEMIQQEIGKKVMSILNKLAPEKFDTLSDQILHIGIDNEEILKIVIDKIFDKALTEAFFSAMYAQMCKKLSDNLPEIQDWISLEQKNNIFRRMLLNKCQQEFEQGNKWTAEEAKAREEKKRAAEMTAEEREEFLLNEEKRIKGKIRSLGNLTFVGELFKLSMLTEKIMHSIINQLLKDPQEEDIESLSKLVATVGKSLDHPRATDIMNSYFNRISTLSKSEQFPSRIRFMLKDLIDLRRAGWKDRNAPTGPKTLAEIRKDTENKQKEKELEREKRGSVRPSIPQNFSQQNRNDRGSGNRSKNMGNNPPIDFRTSNDGWSTVTRAGGQEDSNFNNASRLQQNNLMRERNPSFGRSNKTGRSNSPAKSALQINSNFYRKDEKESKPKASNIYDLLSTGPSEQKSSNEEIKTSPSVKLLKKLTAEEIKNKIPSCIKEWFGVFDKQEVALSLKEIGPDNEVKFLTELYKEACQQKLDHITRTVDLIRGLLKDSIIGPQNLKQAVDAFIEYAVEEDLFSEYPLTVSLVGATFGNALLDDQLLFNDVLDSLSNINDGRNPESSKVFVKLYNQFKSEKNTEEDIADMFGGFNLKDLWGDDNKPDEETFNTFLEKNKGLDFFLEQEEGNNEEVETEDEFLELGKILEDGFCNDLPAKEIIDNVTNTLDESTINSSEFIAELTKNLMKYFTSQTIFKDNIQKATEPTRETFIQYEELLKKFGIPILKNFLNQSELDEERIEKKFKILNAIISFCKSKKFPTKLLEDFFRLLNNFELIEEEEFLEFKSLNKDNKDLKIYLNNWYKSLENSYGSENDDENDD
ncbi:Eukaryotic translation initiation factor 4 gamma [Lobulomyces angularis]|nr:Eukaryotic translation initiation factor 4 gamma [Lobulomyces angularis]